LEFGLSIEGRGYNIFVSGDKDCGKSTISKIYAKKFAKLMKTPLDWIVVNNFDDPNHPKILPMQPGNARKFVKEYQKILLKLFDEIPAFFEGDDYQSKRKPILDQLARDEESRITQLEEFARSKQIKIQKTKTGYTTIPQKDGKDISPEEFGQFDKEERTTIRIRMESVQEKIYEILKEIQILEQKAENSLDEIIHAMLGKFIEVRFSHIEEVYTSNGPISEFLKEVVAEICASPSDFMEEQSTNEDEASHPNDGEDLIKYAIKVLVDNSAAQYAPVIYEMNPTYKNLFGFIEKESVLGALQTNFTKIQAGAMHRANGGILLLDAEALISHPHTWTALKRALRTKTLTIEDSS